MGIEIGIEWLTLVMVVSLVGLLAAGLPMAFVTGGLGCVFLFVFGSLQDLTLVPSRIFPFMTNHDLAAIPLYIFMAAVLERVGIIEQLFDTAYKVLGGMPGGLASAAVVACTILAAVCGVVGATEVAMGIIALPAMLRRNYNPELAMGSILAGGTLGILIPPSVLTIVYAVTAQISIGKMLIAGIMPGAILAALYIAYIVAVSYLKPGTVPPGATARVSLGVKLRSLRSLVLPSLIIVMILGSIFFGIATPTEAAAVGVVGAMIAAALRGRLSTDNLSSAAVETLKATAMILWITIGAKAYVAIFTGLGGADTLMGFIRDLNVHSYMVLAVMMLVLIFLGTVLDEIGIILLTVPVFLPIVRLLGFDEVWFGVLYAITIQMGYISPPFGYTLFYIKGTLPKHLGMDTVYRGIIPFFLLQVLGLLICAAFPGLVTWLPRLMVGG